MSRQSDIKALMHLRDLIEETKFMIQTSQSELEKYEKYEKELTTTKFVFKPLPTNQAEVATSDFHKKWTDKYSDASSAKKTVSIIFTIITVLLAVFLLLDMILMTGIIYDVSETKEINTGFFKNLGWFAYLVQVLFSVFAVLLPWMFFSETLQDLYYEQPIGTIAVSGILTLLFWYVSMAFSGLLPLILFATVIASTFLARGVTSIVYAIKKKFPSLNTEQMRIVEEKKLSDKENAVLNVEKEKKDREEWETWWDTYKFELDEKMDIHMKMAKSAIGKAEELQKQVEESDVLGPNEKHVETINWLIYFLEGHRADNIKESLQQFDLMQHNEKMLAIEREKLEVEAERIRQEHEDRQRAMEMERYHQMQMEAQAQRAADIQSQIAYNTAAAARSAEKMRREAASVASATADFQNRMANEATWRRLNDYYNN